MNRTWFKIKSTYTCLPFFLSLFYHSWARKRKQCGIFALSRHLVVFLEFSVKQKVCTFNCVGFEVAKRPSIAWETIWEAIIFQTVFLIITSWRDLNDIWWPKLQLLLLNTAVLSNPFKELKHFESLKSENISTLFSYDFVNTAKSVSIWT